MLTSSGSIEQYVVLAATTTAQGGKTGLAAGLHWTEREQTDLRCTQILIT